MNLRFSEDISSTAKAMLINEESVGMWVELTVIFGRQEALLSTV
jgi:hypothetical protein